MNQRVNNFALFSCLGILPLIFAVTAHASVLSQSLVSEGRALLFNGGSYSTAGLLAAHDKFVEAVDEDAADKEARLFLSITRLPALVDNGASYTVGLPIENFRECVESLGVDSAGMDVFDWSASFTQDIYGDVHLPANVPGLLAYQNFLKLVLLPEIDQAIGDLTTLTSTFTTTLTTSETGEYYDMEVDYGDVLLYRSALYFLKTFFYIITSYDLDIQNMDEIVELINDDTFNLNDHLFDVYPQLLMLVADGAQSIELAKNSLLEAIESYSQASSFIKNETDPQDDDLFALEPDDLQPEADFLDTLMKIQTSLNEQIPVEVSESDEVNFSQFFEEPLHIREHLPAFVYDPYTNEMISSDICTVMDRTFSGIFPLGLEECFTPPGDVDHTGKVNLKDAVLATKISAGMIDRGFSDADVNNDARIGIEEVLYILKSAAQSHE